MSTVSAGPWIGVDLDGTLAVFERWTGADVIGEPVPAMVARVKAWLAEGRDVRIFTARVSTPDDRAVAAPAIAEWCIEHIGRVLPITNVKDYGMLELWDDRVVQVVQNTGERVQDNWLARFRDQIRTRVDQIRRRV